MEDITRFVEASNSSNVERKLETLEQVSNAIDSINFASIEAADYEDLLEATVKGIRTPQLKLCQQTLSFISILLAKVASSPAKSAIPLLKTLTVFTVSAIIDKFADGKEKVREQAQFVILDLYRTIHRGVTTSSAKETNAFQQMLNFMDREIKNNGLGHKTTRGREQSMLCIAHCVMEIPAYAVRQFIPTIIKLLEDSNEGVRNGSKDALIKIHNHTASKLVRQDIRRELIKNKIRQSIVDQLVAEFIHRPDENVLEESTNSLSECSDPPSSHGTTADSSTRPSTGTVSAPQASDSEETLVVKVDSSRELEHEISRFIALFEGKETEENWKSRDNALLRLRGICRGNARQYEGFIHLLRGCSDAVTKTMHSLRTTLVLTTCKTVEVMAEILGVALDPLADAFMTNLMKLTGMAKKLIATASIEAIQMILNHCPFHLKYLQLFHTTMSDKSINSRAASASFIKQTLELMASVESKRHSLDRAGGLDVLEKALKKGLQDAHGPVRQICREAFAVFQRLWPERGAHLFTQLDVATRKAISREKVSEEKKSKVTLAAARAAFLKKAAAAKVAQASLEAERSIEIEIFAPPTPPPAALNDQFVVPMKEVESKETQSTVAAQVVMDHDTVRETTPQQEVDSSPIGLFLLSLREGDVEEKIHNLELFCQSLREQPEMAAMFSGQILRSLSDAIYDVLLQYSSDNVVSVTRNMETLVECRIIDEQQVAQVVRYLIIRFEQTQPESVAHLRNFANTTVTPGTLVALLMEHLSKENSSHAVNMLVDWIAQLFNDERDRLMEYFENPDAKRFCFHVLVSRFGPSSPNLRALQLLSFINELDQRFFEQLLETCDHETKDLVAEALQGPLEGERTPPATSLQTDRIQVEDISRIDAGEGGTMLDMTDMTFDTSLMLQNGIPDLMEETMPYGMADMSCIQASVMTAHAPTASLSAPMDPQLAHHFNSPIKSTAFEAHDVGNRSARGMLARSAGDSDDGHDLDQTVNDTPSPQSVKTSAGMVGIKRQSAEELLTPVKKIFKSRSERVFQGGTPQTPSKRTRQNHESDLPGLIRTIGDRQAEPRTWRKLYRICDYLPDKSNIEESSDEEDFWARWFDELLDTLLNFLREGRSAAAAAKNATFPLEKKSGARSPNTDRRHAQDTCILILTRLLERHPQSFAGHETSLLLALFEARSDGTDQLAGSATVALTTMTEKLDSKACLDALLALLPKWDETCDFGRGNLSSTQLPYTAWGSKKPLVVFEPSPPESGLEILGKLMVKLATEDAETLQPTTLDQIGQIVMMYLNCPHRETRLSATLCLVQMHTAINEQMWSHLPNLSRPQKILIKSYIDDQE